MPKQVDTEAPAPRAVLDENGHEVLDNSPVAIPLRFTRVQSEFERVAHLVRLQMSVLADDQGYETFDEANDFDVGDDLEFGQGYEELDNEETFYAHRSDPTGRPPDAPPISPGGTGPTPGGVQPPRQGDTQPGSSTGGSGAAAPANPTG